MNACITPTIDITQALPRLRCLWLSRDIPFPQDAGDRIYSGNLAAALTRANVEVSFLGFLQNDIAAPSSARLSGTKLRDAGLPDTHLPDTRLPETYLPDNW